VWGTIGWLALLGACLLVEVVARRDPANHSTLAAFTSLLASRRVGRGVLLVFWAFVGLHLFSRYTVPGHL
jgi:hypothetical protein